jgi:uncharacterized protein (DUF934 family)
MTEPTNTAAASAGRIIKDGAVVDDNWQLLRQVAEDGLPSGPIIVPLDYWLQQRDALLARGEVGVWLSSEQPPAPLAADLHQIPVIAVDFPLFTDGRGFSYGRALREQLGYTGELRAVGQFIRDQMYYLSRCGFNAYAIETADPEKAVESLNDFSDSYSAGVDQPLPWFRRS